MEQGKTSGEKSLFSVTPFSYPLAYTLDAAVFCVTTAWYHLHVMLKNGSNNTRKFGKCIRLQKKKNATVRLFLYRRSLLDKP